MRAAEKRIAEAALDHEYAGIGGELCGVVGLDSCWCSPRSSPLSSALLLEAGVPEFVDLTAKFALGEEHDAIKNNTVGAIQVPVWLQLSAMRPGLDGYSTAADNLWHRSSVHCWSLCGEVCWCRHAHLCLQPNLGQPHPNFQGTAAASSSVLRSSAALPTSHSCFGQLRSRSLSFPRTLA